MSHEDVRRTKMLPSKSAAGKEVIKSLNVMFKILDSTLLLKFFLTTSKRCLVESSLGGKMSLSEI